QFRFLCFVTHISRLLLLVRSRNRYRCRCRHRHPSTRAAPAAAPSAQPAAHASPKLGSDPAPALCLGVGEQGVIDANYVLDDDLCCFVGDAATTSGIFCRLWASVLLRIVLFAQSNTCGACLSTARITACEKASRTARSANSRIVTCCPLPEIASLTSVPSLV